MPQGAVYTLRPFHGAALRMSRRPSSSRVPGALLGATVAAALFGGCGPFFQGPYPCISGYASCNANNYCETSIATDPLNCGSCAATCAQGASCQNGTCGEAPVPLASTLALTSFALNDSDLFFWSADQSGLGVSGIDKTGGAFSVSVPGGFAPAGPDGLVADDAHIYYWVGVNTVSEDGGMSNPTAAILSIPAPQGGAERTVGPVDSTPVSGTALTLVGSTLALVSLTPEVTVVTVPTSGGAPTSVATFSDVGALAFDADSVYTSAEEPPCILQSTPLTGGSPTTIAQLDLQICPTALASDGTTLYWAGPNATYPPGASEPMCMLQVGSIPVGGGSPKLLTSVSSVEAPVQIVVDTTNLYVATSQSVWRLATSGGTAVRLAGAFNPAADACQNGAAYTLAPAVAIAVDETSLFVSACSSCASVSSGGALFKLAK
jgi:hypothetical protein